MKLIQLLCCMMVIVSTYGQTRITGVVKDEKGNAIPGANAILDGTYDGATSSADGAFSFNSDHSGDQVLVVTFIGYKQYRKEIQLTSQPVMLHLVLKEEINELTAVTISAGSFTAGEEKRRTILKAVDIATTAGATADIAGALNTLPGTQKVGETGRLFVRGGDSDETRTFIDGQVVLNPYSPSVPNTPSRGRFLPFMFKGTSFSTGGYSAEYGQGISSALILNSKDKADFNQTDIGVLSVGGDVAHTQVWDKASLGGKVQYTNIRPYFNFINQRVDWEDPVVSLEGSAAYRQQVSKDGMFKFFGNFNQSSLSYFDHGIADPSIRKLFALSNHYAYGNASYKQSVGSNSTVRGGISYNYNGNDLQVDGMPVGDRETGFHSKVVFDNSLSDKIELKAGAEVIAKNYGAWRQQSGSKVGQSFTETISATFLEAEAYASNRFVVRGGLRTEFNSLARHIGLDPRISLAYKPGQRGQFALAYGRFRQSVKNQYLRENNSLGSETAEHFILNYQIISDKKTFRVESYYKKYNGLVKYNFAGQDTLLTNNGSGYARGIEFFWRDNETIRNADYWISYSYLDTKRDYLNYPGMAIPTFASRHNFSFVYKHFLSVIKSQIGVTYSYSSPRPYHDPNTESFNSCRTPYYQDVSANVSWLPRNWIIVYVSCTNLFGRDNIFGYQFSPVPDANGWYASRPILQPAKHFLFLGVFVTISKNKTVNQLPNL